MPKCLWLTVLVQRAAALVAAAVALAIAVAELAAAAGAADPTAAPRGILAAVASSCQAGTRVDGPLDGDRFSAAPSALWRGEAGQANWWWQVDFGAERMLGAILQVLGDDDLVLRHAPRDYVWQISADGHTWVDVSETQVVAEQRCFRVHRFARPRQCRAARIAITAASDGAPALREAEFLSSPAEVQFPPWLLTVNTEPAEPMPFQCPLFVELAHQCEPGYDRPAQAIAIDALTPEFLAVEPVPLCAFLTGNLRDWCQQPRAAWRGMAQVLDEGGLPIWASCGGAQGLAIVSAAGVDRPWDCPHCRDPHRPLLPIYTHIGHIDERPCGDYAGCVFERGPRWVRQTSDDPVFADLGVEFQVMESHCGQIAYPPPGWNLVLTAGRDAETKVQCLRRENHPIYAAQFHVELPGAPQASGAIMRNFLRMAQDWGGYRPRGRTQPTR